MSNGQVFGVMRAVVVALTLTTLGCPPGAVNYPAAGRADDGTFAFQSLNAILKPGGPIVNVGPSSPGTFRILGPGRRGSFGLFVYAPWPSTFEVTVNGAALTEGAPPHGDTAGNDAGYWLATLRQDSTTPGIYEITVVPPIALASAASFSVAVRNISNNTSYSGATNPQHISQTPIAVTLIRQLSSEVSVSILSGNGTITSDPAGISCPPDCSFDFATAGAPNPVVLHASPSSAFSKWSGACAGSGAACSLAMSGIAQGAAAAFVRTTGAPAACPAPATVPGKSYFMSPLCDANLLGAIVQCDATKYFCCFTAAVTANDPICGAGHQFAAATCGVGTAPDNAAAPTGCFL